ncbi:uncharacterized protein LOC133796012 [Humulus lupulus]|uniref:uncharacterized protein LOC133796012 n=1 Tax=Humulus lupulus TaxID=3486 RepID=UPI002B409A7D|nr:uncharacterized protein LOC133796012 [Humulus lupulus]
MDLSKAYDSIDWYFLEDLLKAYYFLSRFIQWIMAAQHKDFRFHPLCKKLNLVNLCFADDLILFCKGSFRSVQILHASFRKFSQDSGLTVNLSKSHIYFGGFHSDEKRRIMECLKIEEDSFPLKYLGMFLRPTKWKVEDCGLILKKIQSRLHTWSSRNLSFAGRSQLIQSVLLGIRAYWMSIFLLPPRIIQEIDILCRNFLWGAKGNRSKFELSRTLYGSTRWQPSIPEENFWAYNLKSDVSWYWRKIIKLRDAFSYDSLLASVNKGKFNPSCLYNQLVQKDKVHYAKLVESSLCPVCDMEVESHAHLFFDCAFSQQVLHQIHSWLGQAIWPSQYLGWLSWMEGRPRGLHQRIIAAVLATAVYYIWINRNCCVFSSYSFSVLKVDSLILMGLKARLFGLVRSKLKADELRLADYIQHL